MKRLAIFISLLLTASPATAAAIVNVEAFWYIAPVKLQDGISVSCIGDSRLYSSGCWGELGLSDTEDQGARQLRVKSIGGLRLMNVAGSLPGELLMNISFSSFSTNSIGVRITDPDTERAAFSSMLWGDLWSGDQHSCDTAVSGDGTFSRTACGVHVPDFSTVGRTVQMPGVGTGVDFMETLEITADLFGTGGVPVTADGAVASATRFELRSEAEPPEIAQISEPGTLAMFGAAGLLAILSRQRKQREAIVTRGESV